MSNDILRNVGVYDMKIKNIEIEGIGGIQNNLNIAFNDKMNIICGINGTNKTTILNCIARFFSLDMSEVILRRNSKSEVGKCIITVDSNAHYDTNSFTIEDFSPIKSNLPTIAYYNESLNLINIKLERWFSYQSLSSIPRDAERNNANNATINEVGISHKETKGWFINRYLFSNHENSISVEQKNNLEIAKKCFSILDSSITFSRIIADSYDIMLNTPTGEIYFEYLSAGYKSCLFILLGIIREIEFRFKNPYMNVNDFNGMILIDEVDLHLHPKWQSVLVNALKEIFSHAQIILTTHSPHIIQAAQANEVIPLILDNDGNTMVRPIETNEYGFQGWTVEEILKYVMGMEDTRSKQYTDTKNEFEKALSEDNMTVAKEKYDILKKMIHPDSHVQQLLDIRMAGAGYND